MNKKTLLSIGLALFISFASVSHAELLPSLSGNTNSDKGSSLIDMYQEIGAQEKLLNESNLDLSYLKNNFISESSVLLEGRYASLEDLNNKIKKSKEAQGNWTEESEKTIPELKKEAKKIQEDKLLLEIEIEDLERVKNEEILSQEEAVSQKEKEIASIKINIEKAQELFKQELEGAMVHFLVFVGIILFVLLVGMLIKRAIKKNSFSMHIKRREMLIRIVNIVVYSVVIISITTAFFSQFVVLLPFLALLGTGLAFAVRDVISSFIAWFFVGMRHGFKIGDLIEIGGARGRVKEINFIHTIMRESGERGPTGKVISIPNNMIFQGKLRNFSAMYRFTWQTINFFLEKNSDTKKAKDFLLESINENIEQDLEEITKSLPALTTKFSITEDSIQPQVFVELDEKGIRFKGKFFCKLDKRHKLHTAITESFLRKIRNREDIGLRFLGF